MRLLRFFIIAIALIACSCSNTPFIGELSPQAAKRQAQHDFAAGKPKIYKAGGYASYEPGIADTEKKLVAKLPRDSRLVGCTNPNVTYSQGYATAYNREIIRLMRRKPSL